MHIKPPTPSEFTEKLIDVESKNYIPVLMSATLTTNKKFDFIAGELGLNENRKEIVVTSPFDLSENLLWYLPSNCPPGNAEDHQTFVLKEMLNVIEQLSGRTLCLFTSHFALRTATSFFRENLSSDIAILSQHETPKSIMIRQLRQNPNTVLLGTKSLFTGIDIQGQNLSAVLMDKIPFPMVGDPVNDYLMNQPQGFRKFTLPSAIVTIKQGVGRLNRTPEDKGIVAIFDGRLSTSNYKNLIFGSFDFNIKGTRNFEKVAQYAEDIK
jgi:ATP-dependent DNA helicase DinG